MKLDSRLSPIASTVLSFASRHNLHMENRPVDGGLATRLMFAHPAGGQASIDLTPHSRDQFALESIWWEDDYDAFVRRIYRRERRLTDCMAQATEAALADELTTILSLKRDALTEVTGGYSKVWGLYSKAEFAAMAPKLPFPAKTPL